MAASRGILLDLDNTLYAYRPCHLAGVRAAYHAYRTYLPVRFTDFQSAYQGARRAVHAALRGQAAMHHRLLYFQQICEQAPRNLPLRAAMEMYDAYWSGYYRRMRLYPGVRGFLLWCRRASVPVVALTDMTADVQLRKVRRLRIATYLRAIVTSEEAGVEKPAEAIFRLGLRKLGVRAGSALMIGDDAARDIRGARRLGIPTIQLVCRGTTDVGRGVSAPDFVATDFGAVQRHVAASSTP